MNESNVRRLLPLGPLSPLVQTYSYLQLYLSVCHVRCSRVTMKFPLYVLIVFQLFIFIPCENVTKTIVKTVSYKTNEINRKIPEVKISPQNNTQFELKAVELSEDGLDSALNDTLEDTFLSEKPKEFDWKDIQFKKFDLNPKNGNASLEDLLNILTPLINLTRLDNNTKAFDWSDAELEIDQELLSDEDEDLESVNLDIGSYIQKITPSKAKSLDQAHQAKGKSLEQKPKVAENVNKESLTSITPASSQTPEAKDVTFKPKPRRLETNFRTSKANAKEVKPSVETVQPSSETSQNNTKDSPGISKTQTNSKTLQDNREKPQDNSKTQVNAFEGSQSASNLFSVRIPLPNSGAKDFMLAEPSGLVAYRESYPYNDDEDILAGPSDGVAYRKPRAASASKSTQGEQSTLAAYLASNADSGDLLAEPDDPMEYRVPRETSDVNNPPEPFISRRFSVNSFRELMDFYEPLRLPGLQELNISASCKKDMSLYIEALNSRIPWALKSKSRF